MAYKKFAFAPTSPGLRSVKVALSAFTIVELLVVIVVIGVLVTITIVSYTGITQRANTAAVQSDLSNAIKQIEMFQIANSSYPSTISTDCSTNPDTSTNKCLSATSGVEYTYNQSPTNNNIFCLTAKKDSVSYNVTKDGQILAGPCPVFSIDAGNTLSYPGSGTTWYDLSGNDNNGAMYGGMVYSSVDNSMSFDRLDDYVDTGVAPSSITPVFSGSFWLSRIGTPSDDNDIPNRILTARKGSSSTLWAVGIGGANQLRVMAYNGAAHIYKSGSILSENVIYNIQFTYDDSVLKLYKNGVLDIELAVSIPDLSYQTVIIGDLDTGNSSLWRGKIYSAQLVDYAISNQEALYNFETTKGRYGL